MSSLEGVRAITFDVGGTLITPWPSVGHIYAEIAVRNGHDAISPELLNERFAAAWRQLRNFQHTRAEWAQLVDASFGGVIEPPPSRTFFPKLYERFTEPGAWHIFPDVIPTLERLKLRGFRLGVISNWDERLRPLLRAFDLGRYFSTIVVSCEVGSPKPLPRIFEHAASELGCPPSTILHIGDSQEMDVQGAKRAGFKALLLDRRASGQQRGRVQSLTEL